MFKLIVKKNSKNLNLKKKNLFWNLKKKLFWNFFFEYFEVYFKI